MVMLGCVLRIEIVRPHRNTVQHKLSTVSRSEKNKYERKKEHIDFELILCIGTHNWIDGLDGTTSHQCRQKYLNAMRILLYIHHWKEIRLNSFQRKQEEWGKECIFIS